MSWSKPKDHTKCPCHEFVTTCRICGKDVLKDKAVFFDRYAGVGMSTDGWAYFCTFCGDMLKRRFAPDPKPMAYEPTYREPVVAEHRGDHDNGKGICPDPSAHKEG